jgi:16S rRNA (cytosine967-C5)-methyltransferase
MARHSPQEGVRATAAWVVERTLETMAPADGFLAAATQRFDERDQALLREIVLGTLRWLRRLDDVLESASRRPFDAIEPALRAPLRVAVYQLLFLDRVPAYAVVDDAVELAGRATHRGGSSFANAVLRNVARRPRLADWPIVSAAPGDAEDRLAIEHSHPTFLVRRWLERIGRTATLALLAANNRPKPMHLLAFRDRGGRELLAETLIDEGLEVEASALAPFGLTVRAGAALRTAAFARGEFYVQDEASQLAALVPAPAAGERILDAAAAPGGKSFALLSAEPRVALTMADHSVQRCGTLRANLQRLRRDQPLFVADAAAAPLAPGRFDRVVVDLPCSGTGTLRKNPELKWRLSPAEIGRLASRALDMLRGAAHSVRPGGLLVAITCSLEREENEDVAREFRRAAPDFAPVALDHELGEQARRWIEGPGLWRLPTGDEHDGFTVQALRRSA